MAELSDDLFGITSPITMMLVIGDTKAETLDPVKLEMSFLNQLKRMYIEAQDIDGIPAKDLYEAGVLRRVNKLLWYCGELVHYRLEDEYGSIALARIADGKPVELGYDEPDVQCANTMVEQLQDDYFHCINYLAALTK
jgi:hypothetical protein